MHYRVEQLHDGLEYFIRVGRRLRIGNALIGPPFLEIQIDTLSGLISVDHSWTVQELSIQAGLSHHVVYFLINELLNMSEILQSALVLTSIKVQKFYNGMQWLIQMENNV
ncbi:hypothetical protein TNCV_3092531 [Trichonephila clavipes]|uniref:Uncharacterized protein n=1 Tax=Trichonephila clavipes TaxID=2585209 RepID=A0A8X6S674_TRICX|nr:hypothetical protein TNCV_3092531 [Trichonephila clavipes]